MSASEPPADTARLHVVATTAMTEIQVLDADFRKVSLPANAGEVQVQLPQGVYEVGFRDGPSWQHQDVVLRAGEARRVEEPPRTSPFPVPPLVRAAAGRSAMRAGTTPDPATSEVVLSLCRADNAGKPPSEPLADPFAGVTLVDESGQAADPADSEDTAEWSERSFPVRPGCWRLRVKTGVRRNGVEMPLVVCPGWRTDVRMPLAQYSRENWRANIAAARIRMSNPADNRVLDAYTLRLETNALQSLARKRVLRGKAFNTMIRNACSAKFENPMLGLYGAWLLAGTDEDEVALLDEVVANLTALVESGPAGGLGPGHGFRHPDVEALRLQLLRGEPIVPQWRFTFPPMLQASWAVMLQAAGTIPWLIPRGSLTDRIAGRLIRNGPWVSWTQGPEESFESTLGGAWTPGPVPPSVSPYGASAFETRFEPPVDFGVRRHGPEGIASAPTRGADSADNGLGGVQRDCAIIDAAIHHRAIRDWFRSQREEAEDGGPDGADEAAAPLAPEVENEEALLVQAVHPVAGDERFQRIIDASRAAGPATDPGLWTTERLAERIGLPPATVERAAASLSAKLLEQGRRLNLDLEARSPMARPDLIIPYDPQFLGDGFVVPLPSLGDGLRTSAYGQGVVLDYTHFSLVMHAGRRVAIYTAHNVDAARTVRVPGGLPWKMDERVGEFQLGPEVYANNKIDRGHLVRRQDVLWGTVGEAKLANKATFFYTNAAPQHENFNQDEWVTLEDWVLQDATDFSYRLCVFTGPVLRSDDPVLSDLPPGLRAGFRMAGQAQIPAAFWKLIVLRDGTAGGDDLSAVAFAMRQTEMWNDKEGKRLLDLKVHQVTIGAIERWTGLDFGDLKAVDELEWSQERERLRAAGREPAWPEIHGPSDIVYSRAARRARGMRATRSARSEGSEARLAGGIRPAAGCGCAAGDPSFDAKAAIAALSRDLAQLTDIVANQQKPAPGGRARSIGGTPSSEAEEAGSDVGMGAGMGTGTGAGTAAVPSIAERVNRIVALAPEAMKDSIRTAAEAMIIQADIGRKWLVPTTPAEIKRVVGGDAVMPGGYPSCCCIGDPTDWFCTGVVVAPNVVLTAAHCGREIRRVMVGGNKVVGGVDGRIVPVRHVIVHPRYRAHPWNENDINILVLEGSTHVAPVPLARPSQIAQATKVEVVGFGYNDPEAPRGFGIKRWVTAPIVALKTSDEQDLTALERTLGFHADYEFVAGRKSLGRDSCNGDSGGPAYVRTDAGLAVLGLTSRATQEATVSCGDGGTYVRPDRFRDWINRELTALGVPALPNPD
ncbi:DNA/RNA non-specific endonuclease [Azospirillum rugosum]|uniref:DNA/RNA endonuclease G (NUC1) n=1 Tax=Azospirillum rugosum TaxID=416170 RepID=A0ABS4SSB8_9PROT|nr:DNA/RNA non-specific endonuclease [Azospirillum rugosum]MBP2294998.1 DNA/RNA endonuclease G (NUC1) [Azospirillum rugosum]MDQ0528821.1 DNA/RNA endonuclease G (NUC1) [Azospirillum rugosum]